MKAYYMDDDSNEWYKSSRDGPWDKVVIGPAPHSDNLTPVRTAEGDLVWKIDFRYVENGRVVQRYYRWDWEGDAALILREEIYAAQFPLPAS